LKFSTYSYAYQFSISGFLRHFRHPVLHSHISLSLLSLHSIPLYVWSRLPLHLSRASFSCIRKSRNRDKDTHSRQNPRDDLNHLQLMAFRPSSLYTTDSLITNDMSHIWWMSTPETMRRIVERTRKMLTEVSKQKDARNRLRGTDCAKHRMEVLVGAGEAM
jgi:hypothetical protein